VQYDGVTIQYDCARAIPSLWNEFCGLSELSLHFKESRFFSYITMDYWDHKDSRYIDLLSGSCILCKTSIVREINLLDGDYFLYADDVDFCFRIRQKGEIYYLADAKIIHYGGQSSKQVDDNLWLLRCESTRIFFKKNMGHFYSSGYRLVIVLSQIIKIIFISISSMKHSSYPLKKNLIQCWTLIIWAIKRTRKPLQDKKPNLNMA
jgi:GT2 family glycosyltransferase